MANLLDTIRQNSQSSIQPQGMEDNTRKLQTLLRAKSGKAVGGSDVNSSSLSEEQAVSNANQTLANQIQPGAQIQQAGLEQQAAAEAQQTQLQKADIAQSRRFDTVQTRLKTNQLLQDLEQNRGKLDAAREASQVNQVAQNLRLQNAQYMDSLQREGSRARLDDSNKFNEALADSLLGANKELFQEQLGNKSILQASDRDFKKAMAEIDVNAAYDMFKNDMAASKQRAVYGAVGGLATAAIGAAGKADLFGSSGSATPSSAGDYASPDEDIGRTS